MPGVRRRWEEDWKIYEVALDAGRRTIEWSAYENQDVTEGRAPFARSERQAVDDFLGEGPWTEALHDCAWSNLRPAVLELLQALGQASPPWLGALDLQHTADPEKARALVAAGADPHLLVGGRDALFYASWLGFVDVARELIAGGAPLDRLYPQQFDHRVSALHLAVASALVEEERILPLVDALLTAGAQIDARNERGETPLHLVLAGTPWRPTLAQRLVDGGADVNARTLPDLPYVYDWLKGGWTPLMALFFAELTKPDRALRVRWLLDRGADLEVLDAQRQAEAKRLMARQGRAGAG